MNKKELYKIFRKLTKTEIICIYNYIIYMSNSTNELVEATILFTHLLAGSFRIWGDYVRESNIKTMRFVLSAVSYIKNYIFSYLMEGVKDE